jgi:SAM-dependent methyltransferase
MNSETSVARPTLAQYCVGKGLDIGFGGDAITDNAWSFDQPVPYTTVGRDRQIFRGDCRKLSFLCDGSLDFIYSSHLLEDFTYADLIGIISEWRRVLAPNGVLIINCPDQKRFIRHCAETGQSINDAHKEADFSLRTFMDRVLVFAGVWNVIHQKDDVPPYSWHLVLRKV